MGGVQETPSSEGALTRLATDGVAGQRHWIGADTHRLISAIEIPPEAKEESNNLVRWRNENGHRNRSHHVMLDAQADSRASPGRRPAR